MTLSHISPQKIKVNYELLPNNYRRHLRAFRWYAGASALLILPIHLSLWEYFHLPYHWHFGLLAVMGVSLLWGVHIFLRRQPQNKNMQLHITEDQLLIGRSREGIRTIKKADLQIEMIGWGPCEEELLPAVRLFHHTELLLTIGATKGTGPWTNIRHSVQATDVILPPSEDWQVFIQALK